MIIWRQNDAERKPKGRILSIKPSIKLSSCSTYQILGCRSIKQDTAKRTWSCNDVEGEPKGCMLSMKPSMKRKCIKFRVVYVPAGDNVTMNYHKTTRNHFTSAEQAKPTAISAAAVDDFVLSWCHGVISFILLLRDFIQLRY